MDTLEEDSFGPFDAHSILLDEDREINNTSGKNYAEDNGSTSGVQLTEKESENTVETIGEPKNAKRNEVEVIEESESKSSSDVQIVTDSGVSNYNDVEVIENINSMKEHSKEPWQYNLETPEECLHALISTSRLSDLTIFVKDCDKPYKVHRLILGMRSPFWEKKLYGDKFEDDTITLTEEEPLPFKHVLAYMYTGKAKFPDVQVTMSVYQLADKYQMGNLMEHCSHFLMDNITTSNVPEVFKTATLLGDAQLLYKCIQIMEVSPDAVFTAPTFTSMCRESVAQLIEQEITVSSEVIVFQALLKWGRSKLESNKEEITPNNLRMELEDFLPKVRFLTMNLEEFVKHVMPSEVLSLDEMRLIQLNIVNASTELPAICNPKREKRKIISDPVPNKKGKTDESFKGSGSSRKSHYPAFKKSRDNKKIMSAGVSHQNSITNNSSRQVSNQQATSQASNPITDQVSRLSGQAFVQQIPNRGQQALSTNRGQQALSTVVTTGQQTQPQGRSPVVGAMASRIQQVQQTWTPAGGLTTVSQSASMMRAAPPGAPAFVGLMRTPLGPRLYAMPHHSNFQR